MFALDECSCRQKGTPSIIFLYSLNIINNETKILSLLVKWQGLGGSNNVAVDSLVLVKSEEGFSGTIYMYLH